MWVTLGARLIIPGGHVSAPDTKHSKPNYVKDAFNLQLFELETQSEQNIKIKINDRTKDTN